MKAKEKIKAAIRESVRELDMATKWKTLNLAEAPLEIIDGDRGKNYPKQGDFAPVGYCLFLNTGNVTENGFNFSRCSFIAEEKDNALRKGKLETEDVVLTTRGTVGNVAFYDERVPFKHIRINSGMVILRADYKNILPKFLYFFLKSDLFKGQIKALSTGSAQPQLPIRDIRHITISVPPLSEQHTISEILGNIDDKMALNLQMNGTLEKIGQAIFKHWFIDFEFPNEKGKPYKSSGGKMVDSELGKIPEGWEAGRLGGICEITMGQSPPGHSYNEDGSGLPFYQGVVDFGFRFPSQRVYCTAPTRFAEGNDVLLSVRAPVGNLNIAGERCAIGRGVAALRLKEKDGGFLYYLLRATQSGWEKFEAEGTVFGSVTKSDVHDFEVVIPPKPLREGFASLIGPMDEAISNNEKQSRALMAIRDSLLPKLMSGQIRVPAGDKRGFSYEK